MDWNGWLIEHIVEIISLIVAIAGFGFTIRYLYRISIKQNISLENSKNNNTVQIGNNVSNVEINQLKEKTDNEIIPSNRPLFLEKNIGAKELLSKIESRLDEEKPISTIVEMCLRLAGVLDMKKDKEWLSGEVNGFYQQTAGGLEIREIDEESFKFKSYRCVKAKLYLQAASRPPTEFEINMFISQPVREIESWANQFSDSQPLIMRTAPLKLMVDTLHISPDEQVPYIIKSSAIKKILIGLRLELNKFVDSAREKLK